MAKFRKTVINRTNTPDWLLTCEALALAVIVYAVLYFLIAYQPPGSMTENRPGAGVSLLNEDAFSRHDWQRLQTFIEIHDPSIISRADNRSGYAAVPERHRTRQIEAERSTYRRELAAAFALPEWQPLPAVTDIALPTILPGFSSRFGAAGPPAPLRTPAAYDDNGREIALKITVPAGVGSLQPTVAMVWCKDEINRHHLLESSGVAALDAAALQALAGCVFPERTVVTVYWPLPAVEVEP